MTNSSKESLRCLISQVLDGELTPSLGLVAIIHFKSGFTTVNNTFSCGLQ